MAGLERVNVLLFRGPDDIETITNDIIGLLDTPEEKVYVKNNLPSDDKRKAKSFVNFLHSVLDLLHSKTDSRLHQRRTDVRRLMSDIAKNANVFPDELYLQGVRWDNSARLHSGGSYADVFVGSHEGQEVAIKRLRIFDTTKIESRARDLCREALICRQLQHERLLPLLGIVNNPTESLLCLVTPWIDSGNLDQYQRKMFDIIHPALVNPLPLLIQVAEGLSWLHGENMVHGDIKADNILVDDKGNVKITDFGLTLHVDNTGGHTGMAGGSLRWMAPELHIVLASEDEIKDEWRPSDRADVYSFAHTMVEAYTLTRPFPQIPRDNTVIFKVVQGYRSPRPNSGVCFGRHLSDGLWTLIGHCWAQQPGARPKMGDVLAELTRIYKHSN